MIVSKTKNFLRFRGYKEKILESKKIVEIRHKTSGVEKRHLAKNSGIVIICRFVLEE